MNMTHEIVAWYSSRMPGVLFEDKVSPEGGPYTKVSWQGRSYTTTEFTTIDDMVLKALIDYNPEAPKEPPEPFNHTHSEEAAYDEYKTPEGHRITVVTEKGQFKLLDVRMTAKIEGDTAGKTQHILFEIDNVDEINNLLTALHAAVAGIHKRKDPQ